jgi:hypothetical protein
MNTSYSLAILATLMLWLGWYGGTLMIKLDCTKTETLVQYGISALLVLMAACVVAFEPPCASCATEHIFGLVAIAFGAGGLGTLLHGICSLPVFAFLSGRASQ